MISKVSVLSTATVLSTAKPRRWILVQNVSDTDVHVAFDGSATVTAAAGNYPGHLLRPGEGIALTGEGPSGATDPAVYAIHGSTGSKTVVVQEY
jgi:hypothetical protein